MKILFRPFFCRSRDSHSRSDEGFATAEYAVLMVLTIIILIMFVQILIVENMRTTALASLRDAARAGTRVVDIQTTDNDTKATAENACVVELEKSIGDLAPALNKKAGGLTCAVRTDARGHNYMTASISDASANEVNLFPGAKVFQGRLKNLSATYIPTESAK